MIFLPVYSLLCRQSSESSPTRTAPASFRSKLSNRSLLPRPPAKSNSPLNTTDSVLDEPSSQLRLSGSSAFFGGASGGSRRSSTLSTSRESFRKSTASIKRKLFCSSNTNGSATIVNKPLECNPELSKRLSKFSKSFKLTHKHTFRKGIGHTR